MEEKQYMSVRLPFAKIEKIDSINAEFDHVKIYAFGVGANRNFSYVSKEELDKALPSLNYLPVVGKLHEVINENGEVVGHYFGGHDYTITDDLQVKMLTVPYGVVLDGTAKYETVQEYGKDVEYITTEAYLWTGRYPEMKDAIYSDETWFAQSAELTFEEWRPWEENSMYTELLGINFSALCLLGKSDDPEKNTEPCFISAKVEPINNFSLSMENEQFGQLMSEMREQLAASFEYINNSEKGGTTLTQNERDAIFEKFSLTATDVDFAITEDMTAEELTGKLEAFAAAQKPAEEKPEDTAAFEQEAGSGEEPADDGAAEFDADKPEQEEALFSMTYREKRKCLSDLCASMSNAKYDEEGHIEEETYCYLDDFDDEHMYFTACHYTKDSYEEKAYRISYEFADGNAAVKGEAEEVFQKWLTAEEIKKLDEEKEQLNSLIQFKAEVEKKDYEAKADNLLASFKDVSSLEEFEAIKNDIENGESKDLSVFETRLFALRGKQVKFEAQQQSALRVGIDADDKPDHDEYGGLLTRVRARKNK